MSTTRQAPLYIIYKNIKQDPFFSKDRKQYFSYPNPSNSTCSIALWPLQLFNLIIATIANPGNAISRITLLVPTARALAVLGCFWLFLAVFGCFGLIRVLGRKQWYCKMVAKCGNSVTILLFLAVFGCFGLIQVLGRKQ